MTEDSRKNAERLVDQHHHHHHHHPKTGWKQTWILENCIKIKINLIFIFTLFGGASKGFMKAVKEVKIKI